MPSSRVAWRDVVLFAALAYGLAWALWLALVPDVFDLFTAPRTPEELDVPGATGFGMFAPLAAAVIMRLFVSREGIRGSLRPFGRWYWYAVAVLAPMLLVSLILLLDEATGLGDFSWQEETPLWVEYAGLALNGLTFSAFLAFGEEYGWRGYLLPKLLPLGEVRAAVIVGLIWGPWHIPLILAGLNYPGVNPWAAVALFLPGAVVLSLLLTRLFVAATGSVLVVSVAHGSLNSFGDKLAATEHLSGNPLVVTPAGAIGLAVFAAAAVVAYIAPGGVRPFGSKPPTTSRT